MSGDATMPRPGPVVSHADSALFGTPRITARYSWYSAPPPCMAISTTFFVKWGANRPMKS